MMMSLIVRCKFSIVPLPLLVHLENTVVLKSTTVITLGHTPHFERYMRDHTSPFLCIFDHFYKIFFFMCLINAGAQDNLPICPLCRSPCPITPQYEDVLLVCSQISVRNLPSNPFMISFVRDNQWNLPLKDAHVQMLQKFKSHFVQI